MKRTIRLIQALLLLSGLASLLSCGEVAQGFAAPFGSSISGPTSRSFTGVVGAPKKSAFTYSVFLPSGDPANGVQITFLCDRCSLLDTVPPGAGASVNDPDTQLALAANSGSLYNVKTNRFGQYTIWAEFPTSGATYTAQLGASIGFTSMTTTITVSP